MRSKRSKTVGLIKAISDYIATSNRDYDYDYDEDYD
jgi:hypothetical protein